MLGWASSALVLTWAEADLVSPPALPHLSLPRWFLQHCLSYSPSATCSEEPGQFSCSQVFIWGSFTLTTSVPAVLFDPTEVQGPFFLSLSGTYKRVAGSVPLLSCLQLQLSGAPDNRVSSGLLPKKGVGHALLCAAVSEGQGQFSQSPNPRANSLVCCR